MDMSAQTVRFTFLALLSGGLIFGAYRFQVFRTQVARDGQVEISRAGSEDAESRLLQIASERLERAKELYLKLEMPWPAEFVKPIPSELKTETAVREYDQHEQEISRLIAIAVNHAEDGKGASSSTPEILKRHREALGEFLSFERSTQAQREQFEGMLRDYFKIENILQPDQGRASEPVEN